MSALVQRLRHWHAIDMEPPKALWAEAADEIEALRARVKQLESANKCPWPAMCRRAEQADALKLNQEERKQLEHFRKKARQHADAQLAYAKANKEKVAAYKKQYRARTKEKHLAYCASYRKRHADRIAKAKKENYQRNKDARLAKQRAYRKLNKERLMLRRKLRACGLDISIAGPVIKG